jgi:hypothetical protein
MQNKKKRRLVHSIAKFELVVAELMWVVVEGDVCA